MKPLPTVALAAVVGLAAFGLSPQGSSLSDASVGLSKASAQVISPGSRVIVRCPLRRVRRTITTALPSPWWTTPIVWSLTRTQVSNVGGRPALQCIYGPSGAIARRAPRGYRCRTFGRGFVCFRIRR